MLCEQRTIESFVAGFCDSLPDRPAKTVAQLRAAAFVFSESPLGPALDNGVTCIHGAALFYHTFYDTLLRVVPGWFKREDVDGCDVASRAGLLTPIQHKPLQVRALVMECVRACVGACVRARTCVCFTTTFTIVGCQASCSRCLCCQPDFFSVAIVVSVQKLGIFTPGEVQSKYKKWGERPTCCVQLGRPENL